MKKQKVSTSRIIEAHILFTVPKNQIMRIVFLNNSIDAVVLDLQESYPDGNITRESILSWRFMTVGDVQKDEALIKELNAAGHKLYAGRRRIELSNHKVSDTTGDDSSNEDGKHKK